MTPEAKERQKELQRQRRKLNPDYWKKYYFKNGGKETSKLYYQNNKEKIKLNLKKIEYIEWQKSYFQTIEFKERNKVRKMKNKFGMTPNDYQTMLNNQNGCCAICGKHHTKINKKNKTRLSIDHNHSTGEIRGLLCVNCNSIIGFANDNIEVLEKAIAYLKKTTYTKIPLELSAPP